MIEINKYLDNMNLQYGCGLDAPESWTNFDVSPSLVISKIPVIGKLMIDKKIIPNWPQNVRYGNIITGLPVACNSCDAVYCSHVLEHLSLADFRIALNNTYDYLSDDGVFRFVIPDLKALATEYVNSNDKNASYIFMKNTNLGVEERSKGIKAYLSDRFGSVKHLWMWDYISIKMELENIGFKNIRRAQFNDSTRKCFEEVENIGRWKNCLGIECTKK